MMPRWENLSSDEFTKLKIDKNTVREMVLRFETLTDDRHINGLITKEEAWDAYFALLHACDEWQFREDRERILEKIDTKIYNPFRSKNPEIVMLARLRVEGLGII